jgi:hypothetical protein
MNWRRYKTWMLWLKGNFDEGLKKNPLDLSMGRSQGRQAISRKVIEQYRSTRRICFRKTDFRSWWTKKQRRIRL